MLKLIKKEFVLALHPVTPIMLLLSAMVLIPNYPYVVIFFYVSMAIFFTCLSGRENNDVVYSLNLPIKKSNIVKARFICASIIQMLQLLLMIPLCVLSQTWNKSGNQAGMDPGISLFAVGFIVYGIFNLVFFLHYYRNVNKVGIAFLLSSIVIFVCTALDVISTHAIPFVKNFIDTPGVENLSHKLVFLCIGILMYILITFFTYKICVTNFEKQDLN